MIETPSQFEQPVTPPRPIKRRFFVTIFSVLLVLGLIDLVALYAFNLPPKDFVSPTSVHIEPGTSIKAITAKLEEASVVKSGTLLYFVITLYYEPSDVKASTYVFDEPLTTLSVAKRLAAGDFDSDLVRFTHFEGERATHVASRAAEVLKDFDSDLFLQKAVPLEGKLYPDTYFIPADLTATQLVDLMLQTYQEETITVQSEIENHPLGENGVLTLASILEREANSIESMSVVSGILQGRLADNMPLQADASVEYILDKPLKELTPDDLKIDSPYNTYLNRGLPPTPIGNPGLDAIKAVLNPTASDYVFYITDNEGNFHYAVTYDEHLENIDRYLR